MENKSKVYIQVDAQNRITGCDGGYTMSNITDPENWVFIDEGHGDRYNLCQSHYFEGGLFTGDGIPRYKLANGQPQERSVEEIQADRDDPSPEQERKTLEDRVGMLEADSAETKEALELILSGVTE